MSEVLRYAEPSPRFRRWFAWTTRRMLGKSFHRQLMTHQGLETLAEAHAHPGPVLIASNHASWWDPLIALRLAEALLPGRPLCAPIEMEQYERFGVMRKLGLFGLEHTDPRALPAMVEHVRQRVAEEPKLLIFITPQGAFTDARKKIRIRPGAAALAAALPAARVVTLCGEYTFWQDRKPEAFGHAQACASPVNANTAGWHRAVTRSLQETADTLAGCVIGRDESVFAPLPGDRGGGGAAINPFYDLWLRLRGVGARIESSPEEIESASSGVGRPS